MTDFSSMTDDELKAAYAKAQMPAMPSLASMSDDELKAAYAASKGSPAAPAAPSGSSFLPPAVVEAGKGLARGAANFAGDLGEAVMGPFGPGKHFGNLMATIKGEKPPTPDPTYGQQIAKAAGVDSATPGFAGTVGEFVGNPGSYLGPGGLLAKGITAATAGAGSEAAGQFAEKFAPSTEPIARMVGAIAGGAAPNLVPKIVTPNIIGPEQQANLNILNREGVTATTAGQKLGSQRLKTAESTFAEQPLSGRSAAEINDQVANQFTKAALRRVGENAERATPEVIDRAFTRIGKDFDELSARNTMKLDPKLQDDLLDSAIEYHRISSPMNRIPVVEETINDIAKFAGDQGGALTGAQYQKMRSDLSRAARGSTDPALSRTLGDIADVLDDAMERSIKAANPADAGKFENARREYRNMLVIERAATSGKAENVGTGNITPAALSTAAKTVLGRRSFARGQDDFSELAHAGTAVLTPMPNSGTAGRSNMLDMGKLLGAAVGSGGAASMGASPSTVAMGALGGLLAPAVVGRAVMSKPVQSYLSNQAMPYRTGTSPSLIALLNAMREQNAAQ